MDSSAKNHSKKRQLGDGDSSSDEAVQSSFAIKRHKTSAQTNGQSSGALNGNLVGCGFNQSTATPSYSNEITADLSCALGKESVENEGTVLNNGIYGDTEDTPETQPYDLEVYEERTNEDAMVTIEGEQNRKGTNNSRNDIDAGQRTSTSTSASGATDIVDANTDEKPCIIIEPHVANTDVIDLTQSDNSNPPVLKSQSIQRDAEEIAMLLNIEDVDSVYQKVHKHRLLPNRVEVVTNHILEAGVQYVSGNNNIVPPSVINRPVEPDTARDEESETFGEIFEDIETVKFILRQRHPALVVDPNLIYAELEANFQHPNRSVYVANLITQAQKNQNRSEEDMEVEPLVIDRPSRKNTGNITKGRATRPQDKCEYESELVDEVDIIIKRFPQADENEIYMLLQEHSDRENRVVMVIEKLLDRMKQETLNDLRQAKKHPPSCTQSKPSAETENIDDGQEETEKLSSEEEELINNDPIYRDTCAISRMFPDRDKNEIYAYLEAHHNKSDRINIVTEELLNIQQQSQENKPDTGPSIQRQNGRGDSEKASTSSAVKSGETNKNKLPDRSGDTSVVKAASSAACSKQSGTPSHPLHAELQIPITDEELQPLVRLEQDVETVRGVFPECDPMWLYEQLARRHGDEHRVQNLTSEMFEHRTYPKLKDRLEKEKKQKEKQRLRNMKLNMEEFLDMFPNPLAHFSATESAVTEAYKQHCRVYLRNSFPYASSGYVDHCISNHNSHFTPAFKELEQACNELYSGRRPKGRNKFRRAPREPEQMPEEPDAYFYRELLFVTHEQEITDHLKQKEEAKKRRLEVAKENKEFMECGCCFDDEVLPEDTLSCPKGHTFCNDCIKRSSEEVIGQAKVKFPCIGSDCDSEFPLSTLKKALPANVFSNVLRKTQEEEIRQADIPDLVTCPFCSFATIMENMNDKVFKCQNPECLKESCRFCREPNHIPLRCDEVEKQGETSMRTFIENKMTEAMLRECYRCKKRFYKTEGCNKMTCTCGASMCYVCRKPVKGYEHFGGPNGCPQDTDVFALHRQEMERAAHEARQRYADDHPDAAPTQLRHDPMQHLVSMERRQRPNFDVMFPFPVHRQPDFLNWRMPMFNVPMTHVQFPFGPPKPVPPHVQLHQPTDFMVYSSSDEDY